MYVILYQITNSFSSVEGFSSLKFFPEMWYHISLGTYLRICYFWAITHKYPILSRTLFHNYIIVVLPFMTYDLIEIVAIREPLKFSSEREIEMYVGEGCLSKRSVCGHGPLRSHSSPDLEGPHRLTSALAVVALHYADRLQRCVAAITWTTSEMPAQDKSKVWF